MKVIYSSSFQSTIAMATADLTTKSSQRSSSAEQVLRVKTKAGPRLASTKALKSKIKIISKRISYHFL